MNPWQSVGTGLGKTAARRRTAEWGHSRYEDPRLSCATVLVGESRGILRQMRKLGSIGGSRVRGPVRAGQQHVGLGSRTFGLFYLAAPLLLGAGGQLGVPTLGAGLDVRRWGYPFTARALWLMANRADDQVEDAFNPRTLQSGVLLPVLDEGAPALATGQFPPKSLLDKLGGNRSLDAAARQELRRLVGGEDGRVGALLELWDGSGHLVNLPTPLREAFGAPTIPDAEAAPAVDVDKPRPSNDRPAIVPAVDQRSREEKELEPWAKGGTLDRATDKLRPLLFEAIAGLDRLG